MEEKKSRTDFIIHLKENIINFTLLKFALVAVTRWTVKLVWML